MLYAYSSIVLIKSSSSQIHMAAGNTGSRGVWPLVKTVKKTPSFKITLFWQKFAGIFCMRKRNLPFVLQNLPQSPLVEMEQACQKLKRRSSGRRRKGNGWRSGRRERRQRRQCGRRIISVRNNDWDVSDDNYSSCVVFMVKCHFSWGSDSCFPACLHEQ